MGDQLLASPSSLHLDAYLERYRARTGRTPVSLSELTIQSLPAFPDLVYPTAPGVFAHVHPEERGLEYNVVEPELQPEDAETLNRIKTLLFHAALRRGYRPDDRFEHGIASLFDEVVQQDFRSLLSLAPERIEQLRYHVTRDVARFGPLEPFVHDPNIEDIQAVGTTPVHVVHRHYGMLSTNVRFVDPAALDTYLRNLSERVGRPVSDTRPIVDAALPDGSRINIVYSEDVSRRGPSFSIRRGSTDPTSIAQLIAWGTLSASTAAYLWLCLENNMSLFICGEAACGKTTTLNALLPFIPPRNKIFSAEDTPEVRPPHSVWQRLVTREVGPEDSRVRMYDLLKSALRSRPNYVVVGEIRGAEGVVAFQAMQTGHPTVATLHAENIHKMIHRLTSDPINIPLKFIDNLNIAVFQHSMQRNGRTIRRVTAVHEIEGFSEHDGGIVTRPAFDYDPLPDAHRFLALNNSYLLERKIAPLRGYKDRHQVYRELQHRAQVLQSLVERRIFHHAEVNRILTAYHDVGDAALPFRVS